MNIIFFAQNFSSISIIELEFCAKNSQIYRNGNNHQISSHYSHACITLPGNILIYFIVIFFQFIYIFYHFHQYPYPAHTLASVWQQVGPWSTGFLRSKYHWGPDRRWLYCVVTHKYIAVSAIPVVIKNLITADNFGVDCSQSPSVSTTISHVSNRTSARTHTFFAFQDIRWYFATHVNKVKCVSQP